jgi:hypothetical protein
MTGDFYPGENARNPPVAADDHRSPLDSHVLEAVEGFLLPDAVRVGKVMALIHQQIIWELIFLLEPAVRLEAVRTHSKHHRIYFPEPGKGVAKIARFLRSPGGIVLWIEKKDNVFPLQ